MKIQSAQYLPVSVEVGRVNTEKYARLIQTFFLPMYFNEIFYTLRFLRFAVNRSKWFFLWYPYVLTYMVMREKARIYWHNQRDPNLTFCSDSSWRPTACGRCEQRRRPCRAGREPSRAYRERFLRRQHRQCSRTTGTRKELRPAQHHPGRALIESRWRFGNCSINSRTSQINNITKHFKYAWNVIVKFLKWQILT